MLYFLRGTLVCRKYAITSSLYRHHDHEHLRRLRAGAEPARFYGSFDQAYTQAMNNTGRNPREQYLENEYERAAYSFGPNEAGKRSFDNSLAGEANASGPVLLDPANQGWWRL